LETTTQSIDAKIRSIGSYIDPGTAPGPWLDYVARWLDLPWDDALAIDAKRRVVTKAGALLEQRGTRRGLHILLDALIGRPGRARVTDLTVDHPPARIGGAGCGNGARLPLLLAGPTANAPVLNVAAVLGRACVGVPCDPLRSISPRLRISIVAPPAVRRTLGPLIGRLLAHYVPAGITVSVSWKVMSPFEASLDAGDDEVLVLDGNGPGRLGEDSEIGRVVISRRGAIAVESTGLDVGFRLS
jgi:phage tail-like protein